MQNMELWTVFYLVSFPNMAFGSLYSIHLNKLSFKDAQNYCKPGGFLTNLSSESELAEIQKAIWEKNNKTVTSFWIGLKKKKGQCVDQNTPLNGFRWTEDDGEYLHNINWRQEPMRTCTDERCGRLLVEYSDSGTINGGLGDAACKQKYAFICKRNFEKCPPPSILDSHDIIEPANDPNTRHITCKSGPTFILKCSINLLWNVEGDENSDVSQLCLQCKSGYRRDASGSCVDINECQPSNPCKHTCLNTDGSYKCVCPDNKDSDDCRESTTPTADLDNNDVHPTYSTESVPIHSDGVSKNETAVQIEEQDGDISNIVVPVIIALLIFVVLLVIIAAIVKGCLRRRDVKRARKKAEAVALNGSNSMEKGNENKGHEII